MDRFLEMQTFNAVVDAGSCVNAADALTMSKAAVSRYVVDMETRLGVRLLHRTTRRLSLTDEGQVFYARSKELLAELEEAEKACGPREGLRPLPHLAPPTPMHPHTLVPHVDGAGALRLRARRDQALHR